jgi:hypothetical protein
MLSHDSAESWETSAESFADQNVASVAFSPSFAVDGTLFAATTGKAAVAVCRSTDRGATWARVLEHPGDGCVSLAVASGHGAEDEFIAVAAGPDVVTPAGRQMSSWRTTRVTQARSAVLAVVASSWFANSHTLYAATANGVYRSLDRGHSWQLLHTGMGALPVTCLALTSHESGADVLVAGTLRGSIWRLRDTEAMQQPMGSDRHTRGPRG